MGWKEGQGLGERIDARRLSKMKAAARVRAMKGGKKVSVLVVFCTSLSQNTAEESSDDDEETLQALQGKTFAPREVTIAIYSAKDNVHGIGYVPLSAAVGARK
jgi:hypothetical protein